MTDAKDAYWDELGVAWTASEIEPGSVTPRLRARLKLQSIAFGALVLAGIALALLGAALGAWTTWRGFTTETWFFVSRGIAIIMMSAVLAAAAAALKSRLKNDTKSLKEMIDLSLARTERFILAVRWGYFGCAIAAIFGLAGYALRGRYGHPPAMSPLEPLIVLSLIAVILFLFDRRASGAVTRYRYLAKLLED